MAMADEGSERIKFVLTRWYALWGHCFGLNCCIFLSSSKKICYFFQGSEVLTYTVPASEDSLHENKNEIYGLKYFLTISYWKYIKILIITSPRLIFTNCYAGEFC